MQTELGCAVEPLLLEVADVVNTTLDLDALQQVELVRKVIDYDFGIMLNEKTQELFFRFVLGVLRAKALLQSGFGSKLAKDHAAAPNIPGGRCQDSHFSVPGVRCGNSGPLIIKNRVIGVIDMRSPQPNHFTEEHKQIVDSDPPPRMAVGIENARLYTRTTTLLLLNEIAREL